MDKPSSIADCEHCPFRDKAIVQGYGPPVSKCRAVIIGESPGYNEAELGKPFIGQSGRLIRSMLQQVGFDVPQVPDPRLLRTAEGKKAIAELPEGDVFFTNAALCLPERRDAETYKTSKEKFEAARCCRDRLIAEIKPFLIAGIPALALGGASLYVLTGSKEVGKNRSKWHQKGHVLSSWHPAYILRTPARFGDLYRDVLKLAQGGPAYRNMPEVRTTVIETEEELIQFAEWLAHQAWNYKRGADGTDDFDVAIDIETGNVDWIRDEFICISISPSTDRAFIIAKHLLFTEACRWFLTTFFNWRGVSWVGHNFKFDMRFIKYQLGVDNVRVDYDSLIADYVLDENRRHALKDLLTEFYDVPDYEAVHVQKYLRSKNDDYTKVPLPEMYQYAGLDTAYTLHLWRDLKQQLLAQGLFERPFLYPLMASQELYLEIELRGMLVDRKELHHLSSTFHKSLEQIQRTLERMAGHEFNPNSWMQVGRIMYDKYKMPHFKARHVKNARSTAKPIRELIMHEYDEKGLTPETHEPYKWISLYHQWKQIEKLRSSYVDNMFEHMDDEGRVHPDTLVYGTETGRPSVRNPALQTIPRPGSGEAMGEVWGKRIKQVFIAPPGCSILQVDYSQAELRTAAFLSKDAFLTKVYLEDRDVHAEVAEAWWPGWGLMQDGDTKSVGSANFDKKTLRVEAKKGVFARLYLGTEHAIAGILGISPREAKPYLRALDRMLGGLVRWEHNQLETLRRQGYVTTLTGRRRRFPLITRDNLDEARKAACNSPVQGMASDLTMMSSIEVYNQLVERGLDDIHPLITVHDSLILEVPTEKVEEIGYMVKQIMEETAQKWMPEIPWKADIEYGPNWGELKPI